MNVYCRPRNAARVAYAQPSYGIRRITDALERYAPERIQIVGHESEARCVVIHATGDFYKLQRYTESLLKAGKLYIVIQYVLRGAQRGDAKAWQDIWNKSMFVWSYYDLFAACQQDGARLTVPFYRSPLGVDTGIFKPIEGMARPYIIGTHGASYMSESVRECHHAAQRVGKPLAHLGTGIKPQSGVLVQNNISDADVALLWGQCEFISGLRRTEGFELPAAEGLLCGARPILFDKPHYRHWYGDWAEYIAETERGNIIEQVTALLRAGARPVTDAEHAEAAQRFNWQTIVERFWEYLSD